MGEHVVGDTLAVMITATTYGTWLRGDRHGYVDAGRILPADPDLEDADRHRLKHPPYTFGREQLHAIGGYIGGALRQRMQQHILALAVQTWHVHIVIAATTKPLPDVVKCIKESVRYGLRPGRPIWTDGYDKRFCFDDASVHRRIQYVERHNTEMGLCAQPWPFIEGPI